MSPCSNPPGKWNGQEGGAKTSQEGIAQIESVLQNVRLSWKEAEFLCAVAEMENEESHMEGLLQLLTNCSAPEYVWREERREGCGGGGEEGGRGRGGRDVGLTHGEEGGV